MVFLFTYWENNEIHREFILKVYYERRKIQRAMDDSEHFTS
jgi:hypothetical protein